MSVARVYANVNTQRPKEYWDYESLAITWGCVPLTLVAGLSTATVVAVHVDVCRRELAEARPVASCSLLTVTLATAGSSVACVAHCRTR